MFGTRPELVSELREKARAGESPSAMLRRLADRHVPEPLDRNLLVQYFSEAFRFTDGEAYPIFGWHPDGTGELKDANIDYLLAKRIQRMRDVWDVEPVEGEPWKSR